MLLLRSVDSCDWFDPHFTNFITPELSHVWRSSLTSLPFATAAISAASSWLRGHVLTCVKDHAVIEPSQESKASDAMFKSVRVGQR